MLLNLRLLHNLQDLWSHLLSARAASLCHAVARRVYEPQRSRWGWSKTLPLPSWSQCVYVEGKAARCNLETKTWHTKWSTHSSTGINILESASAQFINWRATKKTSIFCLYPAFQIYWYWLIHRESHNGQFYSQNRAQDNPPFNSNCRKLLLCCSANHVKPLESCWVLSSGPTQNRSSLKFE